MFNKLAVNWLETFCKRVFLDNIELDFLKERNDILVLIVFKILFEDTTQDSLVDLGRTLIRRRNINCIFENTVVIVVAWMFLNFSFLLLIFVVKV